MTLKPEVKLPAGLPGKAVHKMIMKGKYPIPSDLPAAACGRCMWFKCIKSDGWGKCLLDGSSHWYKCMVCVEYEFDPEIWSVKDGLQAAG